MNKTIKWEKFKNPLLNVNASEEEGGRVMIRSTPFGPEAMQFNPDFPSEKVFIGHTNFDIDEEVINLIDNTEGVEVLEVYSSYRMRITIGKAFNSKRIRRKIKEKLCGNNKRVNFNEEADIKIYQETLRLNKQDKPWLMYILPNGSYESRIAKDENELENIMFDFEIIRDSIGGAIISK